MTDLTLAAWALVEVGVRTVRQCVVHRSAPWQGSSSCRLDADGRLTIVTGVSDMSGVETNFAAIAADTFGVAPDRVRVVFADPRERPISEERHEMDAKERLVALKRGWLASHRGQVCDESLANLLDAQPLDRASVPPLR